MDSGQSWEASAACWNDEEAKSRLDLLCQVGKEVGSASQMAPLVGQVTKMTQRTLRASASSVLLLDDQGQELLFDIAEGPAGERLRQLKLSAESGIAGWVVRSGQPLIVNNVARDERFNNNVDRITGFNTKSILCVPLKINRKIIGVLEVLNKLDGSDFNSDDLEVSVSVAATAAMAIENVRAHLMLVKAYRGTIKALAAAIDAKDSYTAGHSQRVTEYALQGATPLSLSPEETEVLEYAGTLHDIGKIGITEAILNSPGPLTAQEWKIVRRHPGIGANILQEIPFLEKTRPLVLHHHERYDGKGYPDGIKGEEIPLGARLLAIADAYEAMTSQRPYRKWVLAPEQAFGELERNTGTQFDPEVVKVFVSVMQNARQAQEIG